MRIIIQLLADRPDLVADLGELRWQEWGPEPGRERRADWVELSAAEAGPGPELPVTFVAIDAGTDTVLGGVGLARLDPPDRHDVSPWVVGTVVRPGRRGLGIGRLLMSALEQWARAAGFDALWVATGGRAVSFYQRCGMREQTPPDADPIILTKSLGDG